MFSDEALAKVKRLATVLMNSDDAHFLGKSAASDNPTIGPYTYKTCQGSRWPCTCRYTFAGNTKHKFHQYGKAEDADFAVTRWDGNALAGLTELMEAVEEGIQNRIPNFVTERSKVMHDSFPSYVVMNSYVQNTSIGEHHDAADLFDAVRNQAVILSLNIQGDGVLFFKLQGREQGTTLTAALQHFQSKTSCNRPGHMHKWGMVTPVFVPENSLLVMGGWCQSVLLHGSLDHASILNPSSNDAAKEAFTVGENTPVTIREQMQRHANAVRARYVDSRRHPTADQPRTVCTLRYVVIHDEGCMLGSPMSQLISRAISNANEASAMLADAAMRRRTSAMDAAKALAQRDRRPPDAVQPEVVPRPEVPRPEVPGAVPRPGVPEARRPDMWEDAIKADMWDQLSPCLCSWADEWAEQCNPLDSALDMATVKKMWDALNTRIGAMIHIAEKLDLKDRTNALQGKLSRQASIMEARIAARLALKRACFQPADTAMPDFAVNRAHCSFA